MQVEIEKKEDGRWIAEVPKLRGALACGASKEDCISTRLVHGPRSYGQNENAGMPIRRA